MNLHDLFAIPPRRSPDRIAVEFTTQDISQSLTYRQLYDTVDRLAAGLHSRGLAKGDRVAFFIGNRPEFVIAYLATIKLGAIMVPINLRYRRMEIGHIIYDCAPRLIVTEQAQVTILADAGISANAGYELLLAEELDAWKADVEPFDPPLVHAHDLAMIMYTSGTTGRSKGAMLSHNNVLATMTGLLSAWAWEADDRLLLCLPLFHTHGLVVGLHCALAAGATVLLREGYTSAIVDELTASAATLFFAVPTIYVRVVEELRSRPKQDFSTMRLFCSGSAPLAPDTFTAFQQLTGHTILERYGMTETGMNLSNAYAGPRVPGSVGTPLPGVSMRIVGHDGADVAPGEEGELLVRGSNVFSGY